MIKEHFKTLLKVIKMRSIIGYNGMVYALKMMPVIGKIIPDALYGTYALKVFYWLIHVIKELFLLFIGKIFGLGLIYFISYSVAHELVSKNLAEGLTCAQIYGTFAIVLFMVYAVCGILISMPVFNCNTEKEYLAFMLRISAKKINDSLFLYDLAKLFGGYLITGVFAGLNGCPFVVWLGIPFLGVLIKLFGAGALTVLCNSKRKHNKPMKPGNVNIVFRVLFGMTLLPVTLLMVIVGLVVPLWIILPFVAVFVLLGVWGGFEYFKLDSIFHRRALHDNITTGLAGSCKKADPTKQFKNLKARGSVGSDKKGFEYLNALFVKRHHKLLFAKPVILTIMVAGLMAFIIYVLISLYYEDHGRANTVNMVLNNLLNLITLKGYDDPLSPLEKNSPLMFFRYLAQYHLLAMIIPVTIADASFKATQAMYINCDNSLMTFSFFKQPAKIMKLFDIRLKQLIKINLPPVIALGFAAVLILFYTGGEDYPLHYLVTMLIPFFMSVIVSLAWLALYYLFQPFTTTVKVKSGAYMTARFVLSTISLVICWIPVHSLILVVLVLAVAVVSVVGVRKVVFKRVPVSWRPV